MLILYAWTQNMNLINYRSKPNQILTMTSNITIILPIPPQNKISVQTTIWVMKRCNKWVRLGPGFTYNAKGDLN